MLSMRQSLGIIGGAVALAVSAGAAVAVLSILPTPSVSVSTLTLRGGTAFTDSVGLAMNWTKRCTPVSNQCPSTWDVQVSAKSVDGYRTVAIAQETRLRDTLRYARTKCPLVGAPTIDTVIVTVHAAETAGAERSNAGVARTIVRCVPLTPIQKTEVLAFADSFPKGSTHIDMGVWEYKQPKRDRDIALVEQLRTTKTRSDSATLRQEWARIDSSADSVRTGVDSADRTVVWKGYGVPLCYIGQNRYTGAVVIISGSAIACEPARQQRQSARSG